MAARHDKWAWLYAYFCAPYEYTNRQYTLNIKWARLTKKQTITLTITIDNVAQYNDKEEWLYVSLKS